MQFPDNILPAPGMALFPRGDHAWLYDAPLDVIICESLDAVPQGVAAVEAATAKGCYAAGFIAYEAAPAFDDALQAHASFPGLPLLYFGVYAAPRKIPWPPVGADVAALPEIAWRPALDKAAYRRALARIREHIARGDTYQVNYTFPLEAQAALEPLQAFCALHARQPAGLGAFIDAGRYQALSLSPELFLRRQGATLRSRPMKGTRRRGLWPEEDRQLAAALAASPKDRAENVMIVDMVRSDLGHVSRSGSVAVTELFAVERYPTVWQMTSEVAAQCDAGLLAILQALFPPASVTGAPKVETMRIIKALEPRPRGVYCGAVGWMAPGGEFEFNVPIRTLLYDSQAQRLTYSVGSGVTWDSGSEAEYEECLIKARVLRQECPKFALLESLRHDADGYFLLEEHLERLKASAQYWDFHWDAEEVRRTLRQCQRGLPETPSKVRLLLHRDGGLELSHAPAKSATPVKVALARQPIDRNEVFLYHKSTRREVYTQALAAHPNCDDVLLWNARGEMTESTMANLVVKLDGQWWTPPVACGLLAGTYRAYLLRQGVIRERVILKSDLGDAEELALINAVRKWIPISELLGL